MMDNTEDELYKNLEFLVNKSRELLKEQLSSYDNSINKAGLLITISSFLVPISISFMNSDSSPCFIKYLLFLPTVLLIIALSFLLRVLIPKGLDHGFNFSQFERLANGKYKELLLYELGANKSSFESNRPIVKKQNRDFKRGIGLIFTSTIILTLLIILNQLIS